MIIKMSVLKIALVFILAGILLPAFSSEFKAAPRQAVNTLKPLNIRFPVINDDPAYKVRSNYFHDVLDLVLSKTRRNYTLTAIPVKRVPSSRTLLMMAEGHFDVSWVHTNQEREEKMQAIRYPIYRGLVGWRLLMVSKANEEMFSQVGNLHALQRYIAGQGHDWPDVPILRHNGLKVREAISRDSVYSQLTRSRVDYFPRGVNEIWDEIGLDSARGAVVEKHVAIHYPTAFYLFVDKSNLTLKQLLESGFELAIKDGSFEKLFMTYMGETITRAKLSERTIIQLKNPNLPKETPLLRKELWFHVKP